MSELREWWANVYVRQFCGGPKVCEVGVRSDVAIGPSATSRAAAYRIHVRLKPEGAPRRYASEIVKWAWENSPDWMRSEDLWESSDGISPRSPKTEASAS